MILRCVAALCVALASTLVQAGSSQPFELKGSVEFAGNPDQYLLVYSSNEASSGPNIYGRVLTPEGAPSGRDFRLSTQSGEMSKPDLAYSPSKERFLVVWGRKLYDQNRSEIVGMSVGLNGQVIGEEFRISVSNLFDTRPGIAYCPGRDRFLVTWTRGTDYDFETGVSDVYGQFVAGNGRTLQGSNFVIASADRNQFKPDVACDVVNDRFLVVWEDQRQAATQDDIYGQLIASDGTMMGGNFPIAGTSNIEGRPVVAANSSDGSYLVVWESVQDRSFRMFSQKLNANGKLQGSPTAIGAELGGGRNRAAVSYLKPQNVFFVVFDNSEFANVSDGIYGQFVEGNGTLRQGAFPVTTAPLEQYRPDIASGRNSFLVVWTDYRDTANGGARRNVYEYYGRVIGNDMALSSRWRNPQSQ